MAHWKTGIAALAAVTLATVALAQTGAAPKDPNMPDAKNVPAEKVAPPIERGSTTGSTGTLSQRLEATEGVIAPPATGDNEMRVPAPVPNPNSTPVIRPPGTLPNDRVQPK